MPNPATSEFCAICADHGTGETTCVWPGHGVEIWLCPVHASSEFQTRREGREFVDVLARLWTAHGCLTVARRKALDGHLKTVGTSLESRQRPGSHAWVNLRPKVEAAFAAGVHPDAVHAYLQRSLNPAWAKGPSLRTLRRWQAQRRWIGPG